MTTLRQKMIKVMQLQNSADQTQRNYLQSVKGLAPYYKKSPDTVTKEMIEDYLLYLKNDKGNTPKASVWSLQALDSSIIR
jgi:hypothetical protein